MKKILILILAGVTLGACNKFDDDINIDPNNPSQASGTQLISNAALFLPGLSSSPQGEYLAQYLAETQYPGGSLYPDGGTNFYGLYQGPLMNLQSVLNSTLTPTDGPIENQRAIAKILKAYFFWHITDRWGDVPYTDALKGLEEFTPKYDTQEDIYDSIFQLLSEANAAFVPGNITKDIIYNGDVNKWRRLGNSIHMLAALRLSKVNPIKGAEEFNNAMAAGVMTANSDNLFFQHLTEEANWSYWYDQVEDQNREWWALTETLVDYMKPLDDPRLPVYGQQTSGGDYVGLEFGTTVGLPNTTGVSLLGTKFIAAASQIYLVTYAQVLFAQAEAAKLGWIPGGDGAAEDFYEEAIRQSFLQWTGSSAGHATYIAEPGVAYEAANALEQIAMQRYVHLFMHGYEAWAEWRRTGYPSNLVEPGGREVPRRNSYPPNEAFNNETNYQEAVQRQFGGTDGIYGRVWWDQL
jgi:hypothetical protein